MEIGLGQMGMSPDEFDNITIAEFLSKQRGFFEFEKHKQQEDWKRTFMLMNIHLSKKDRININTVFADKKPKKVQTQEEFENVVKKWSTYNVTREPKFPI